MRKGMLLYVQGGSILRRPDGALGIHAKTASGLRAFASRWKGAVAVSALQNPVDVEDTIDGHVWLRSTDTDEFSIVPIVDRGDLQSDRPALIHVSVNTRGVDTLASLGVPTVMADDNAPSVRRDIALINAAGTIDRARIRAGSIRVTRRFDRLASKSAGFHANGYASFAHYRHVNPKTLRYFDHRVAEGDLRRATVRTRAPERPLHIAYSGRLVEIKGVRYLPLLATELARRGVNFRISIFGSGPLESSVPESEYVSHRGHLDFDTDWKREMSSVDLMLLPHLQGDSSSTYFEAMGFGVPVLGFANSTLTPLLRDGGGGWEVPKGDVRAAADIIELVCTDPVMLGVHSRRAIEYMRQYPMEKIFDERVADFARVAAGGN